MPAPEKKISAQTKDAPCEIKLACSGEVGKKKDCEQKSDPTPCKPDVEDNKRKLASGKPHKSGGEKVKGSASPGKSEKPEKKTESAEPCKKAKSDKPDESKNKCKIGSTVKKIEAQAVVNKEPCADEKPDCCELPRPCLSIAKAARIDKSKPGCIDFESCDDDDDDTCDG